MTHIQSIDVRFKYDPLHAFGLCTQYYTIMKGYSLPEEIDPIFDTAMTAVGFDPDQLRSDGKRVQALVRDLAAASGEGGNVTSAILYGDHELARLFESVRQNRFFKYSEAWGVGMCRVIELIGLDPKPELFTPWYDEQLCSFMIQTNQSL
jgi:hypothetical protein